MAFLLLIVVAVGVILYLILKDSKKPLPKVDQLSINEAIQTRDTEWVSFIEQYQAVAKTKNEKALIEQILNDLKAQGWIVHEGKIQNPELLGIQQNTDLASEPKQPLVIDSARQASTAKSKAQIQLDNASLLLYFGAFLFIASTGLFVVFGKVSGGIKIAIAILVMGVLYDTGIWLYHHKPRLKQAGLAFAGIGMAVAPLIGLTAYNYLFNKSHGSLVWFLTSILCLILYVHALFTLRKPLINYIFIFTFLSLFESSVSIINAPIYYYGWMLAFIGIVLALVTRIKKIWPDFKDSSRSSSEVILPISILISAALTPNHGFAQLGVSLLLAAAYYGLETISAKAEKQIFYALTAQLALILGTGSLLYAHSHNLAYTAIGLSILNIIQLSVIFLHSKAHILKTNFASTIIVSQLIVVFLGWQRHEVILYSSIALFFVALIIWIHQKRYDAYSIGALSLMAIPFIYGHVYRIVPLKPSIQTTVLFAALIVQLIVFYAIKKGLADFNKRIADYTYFLSSVLVIAASLWTGSWTALIFCTLVSLSAVILTHRYKDHSWAIAAGLFIAAPLLLGWKVEGVFLACNLIALVLNIILSLAYRTELNRWSSTILWILLPLSFGNDILSYHFTTQIYAFAYLLVTIGLLVSRSIARGVIFLSDKIPVASFARSASLSYVVGYGFAGSLTIILSILDKSNIAIPTLILIIVAFLVWYTAKYIEKQNKLLILLPVILQIVLWSLIRPVNTSANTVIISYLLMSTFLALLTYFSHSFIKLKSDAVDALEKGSLIAIFASPLGILLVGRDLWPMPIGLILAGVLVFYHIGNQRQEYRELAGGIVTLGIFWFLGYLHVHTLQVYTHIVVIQLAVYAYWRNQRGDKSETDGYLYGMLSIATVPLTLQAIAGQGGGLYGWWLLLEQIVFMLIGMAINKRFIVMWGLYVAVGAVLYQLRHLGWAALTVLAVFLIGLAIHKILKNS